MSSMSKNSHETDSIPRKTKSRIIPGPLVKAPKVTQEEYGWVFTTKFFRSESNSDVNKKKKRK